MRRQLKSALAWGRRGEPAPGASVLIYHRVGGGSPDERDVAVEDFRAQLDVLDRASVVDLDTALDRLAAGDRTPSVVLTFDDGFRDVYQNAWPLLSERRLPFTLYVSSSYVGGTMHWDGSTAKAAGPAVTWEQLAEMVDSGLCTVGNHTSTHCLPARLDEAELDECSAAVERHLGVVPRHFAWTWGVPVPRMVPALADRFRSAATGRVGRNAPGRDPLALNRIPVRGSDPLSFFQAKTTGGLGREKAYAGIVSTAKRVGMRA